VLVFTGETRGLEYLKVDVTGHPGPWNAEARKMAGELKGYTGSDEDILEYMSSADFAARLAHPRSGLLRILDDPQSHAVRSRASHEGRRPDIGVGPPEWLGDPFANTALARSSSCSNGERAAALARLLHDSVKWRLEILAKPPDLKL
jgi:hypothetical protein